MRPGPEGPLVAGICSVCAFIVVPYRGVGVTQAIRAWLASQHEMERTGQVLTIRASTSDRAHRVDEGSHVRRP